MVGTGQTQNSMHGLERTSRGRKKDPGNRVDEAKPSLQSGSPRETTGERFPLSLSCVLFTKATFFLFSLLLCFVSLDV